AIGRDVLGPGLRALQQRHEVIGEVRGIGVFWAVELVSDRASRRPVEAALVARLKAELADRGLIVFTAEDRIHVVPPCSVTRAQVEHALALLDEVLRGAQPD